MKKRFNYTKVRVHPYILYALILLFITKSNTLFAQNIVYPTDAGVVNVKNAPYNAKGDGATDDTHSIQQAIADNINGQSIIYLPNGTYLVSSTIKWKDGTNVNGGWGAFLSLQGQSRAGTIIRLKNNTFTDAANPQSVIMTGSRDDSNAYSDVTGEGNQAFGNYVSYLTIDVGSGNPGAIGIDYQVSNWGALREVTIKSSDANKVGFCGISLLRRDNGPGIIEKVSVDGFRYGIRAGQEIAQFTLENISLSRQTVVGIEDKEAVLAIRKLTSVNAVPAIIASSQSLLNVIEANLTGGAAGSSAIEIVNNESRGYLRGIISSGYGSALKHRGAVVSGSSVTEWVSDAVLKLNPSSLLSLNLPIEETPTYFDSNLANWQSTGTTSGGDDYNAIQAAMNSGKSTVYFPRGTFHYSKTITVPATVKHIISMGAELKSTGDMGGKSLFNFVGGTSSDITVIDRFILNTTNGYNIENGSQRTVVIKDIGNWEGDAYINHLGAGKLFIDDVSARGWNFVNPQNVWARQFNPEGYATYAINNGGKLWVLGFKVENSETLFETRNGGSTEVFGGFAYTFGDRGKPALINSGSKVSASFCGTTYTSNGTYSTLVSETSGDVNTTLPIGSAYFGRTFSVPMYVGEALAATVQYRVNAGGGADGNFSGYNNFWGNTGTYFSSDPIDVSGITNPAPQSIYQSEIDNLGAVGSTFTYSFPYLKSENKYKVRLHFVELYFTVVNGRKFNVDIDSIQVLKDFDIFAASGAKNKAIVKEFDVISTKNGKIEIVFTNVVDRALINGIEILGAGVPISNSANGNGKVVMEKWTNVGGSAIADNNFGSAPNSTADLTSIEIPVNGGNNYAVRIRGYIIPSTTGAYNLYIASDDEGHLLLSTNDLPSNTSKVAYVSSWTNSREWTKEANQKSANLNLVAGTKYYFEALMKQGNGGDNLAIGWTGPGISTVTIPSGVNINSYVSPIVSGTGLNAEYFDGMDLITLNTTRTDATVNFDWGTGSYATGKPANNFSARWSGQLLPKYNESYTFTTTSDDGVRLWVNGTLIIDNWTDHAATDNTGTIALTAGLKVDIKMEFYQNGGAAVAKLYWNSASQAKEIVPQIQLYPLSGLKSAKSIEETIAKNTEESTISLNVYPNPANQQLHIESKENLEEVKLVDLKGSIVYLSKQNSNQITINVNDFPAGIYFIKAKTSKRNLYKKIVIDK